jgi:hypothetical protein
MVQADCLSPWRCIQAKARPQSGSISLKLRQNPGGGVSTTAMEYCRLNEKTQDRGATGTPTGQRCPGGQVRW